MEITYFNNADYEQFLFSKNTQYNFQLNKTNKEFEYFILITEDSPLYTDSNFSKEYRTRIKKIFSKEMKKTSEKKNLKPWCMALDTPKEIVSKKTALKINQDLFKYTDLKLVSVGKKLKENSYYVLDGELSGRGHYLYPRDHVRIQRLLDSGVELIEEPRRERIRDISTLFLSDNEFIVYENIIDNQCQYKGTIIKDLSKESWYPTYILDIQKVLAEYRKLNISYPFSIDSYFYLENQIEKIKVLSEINARKTMGWMAYWLHQYFSCKESFFYLSRNELDIKGSIQLNPLGKIFNCYFLGDADQKKFNEVKSRL
jgi:hypothetical protein